jgi:hypothetical protein
LKADLAAKLLKRDAGGSPPKTGVAGVVGVACPLRVVSH